MPYTLMHQGVSITWAKAGTPPVLAACRACGSTGDKPVVLCTRSRLPEQGPLHLRFLGCPACGCAFVEGAVTYDYGGLPTSALGLAIHAEAGAGLWPIVRTLARLPLRPGDVFLEIGCGLGFGLDFALRARHWQATGIDPSTMAAAGRDLLGLPIESRYFGSRPDDAAGPGHRRASAILASEVVEHIEDPRGFVAMLRGALAPDGVLVLTTPDRALLREQAPDSDNVPLLSVGAHLVLFTKDGLHDLLHGQGFDHVEVTANGAQLVAYASAAELALERDDAVLRQAYRAYLAERAGTSPPGSLLWWAFAARAYQEAVVDHDAPEADRHWPALRAACTERFGFDPERPVPLPHRPGMELEALSAIMPKALPTLLYARALDRLHRGETLADCACMLEASAGAAEALNAALLRLGATDLATASAGRAALAALAALAADTGAGDSLDALTRAVTADPENATALARKSLTGLVNAGDLAQAEALCTRWDVGAAELDGWPDGRPMPAGARDALFCLAMMDLHEPGQEARAKRRFALVRQVSPAGADGPPGVWWAALRGECIAADRLGEHHHATQLLSAAPCRDMPQDLALRLAKAAPG